MLSKKHSPFLTQVKRLKVFREKLILLQNLSFKFPLKTNFVIQPFPQTIKF